MCSRVTEMSSRHSVVKSVFQVFLPGIDQLLVVNNWHGFGLE